jgi:transposase
VDAQGIPLVVDLTAANVNDCTRLIPLVDSIPPIRRPGGRRRKRPHKVHADKGYDYPVYRRELRRRGIVPRIARRDVESKTRLGRHRWVVERSFAWFNQFRRLIVRYERRADIHLAFLRLAAAILCFRFLKHTFC